MNSKDQLSIPMIETLIYLFSIIFRLFSFFAIVDEEDQLPTHSIPPKEGKEDSKVGLTVHEYHGRSHEVNKVKLEQHECANRFSSSASEDLSIYISAGKRTVMLEAHALVLLAQNIDDSFGSVISLLSKVQGHIIVTGVGKSGIVGSKIAASLSSTGSPAFFMHAADACHGDLGMITKNDVVIAISNSGESQEIIAVIDYTQRFNIPLIAITQKPESSLGKAAMHSLLLPKVDEACSLGLAPTTSSTSTLALGDAIAIALEAKKSFSMNEFAAIHPGGSIGRQLRQRKCVANAIA